MKKRTFSKEQKLAILKEASEQGVNATLAKHGIYPATYYSWKQKLSDMGEAGLAHGASKRRSKELRKLEKENRLLKELVAEKELEIKLLERTRKKH